MDIPILLMLSSIPLHLLDDALGPRSSFSTNDRRRIIMNHPT